MSLFYNDRDSDNGAEEMAVSMKEEKKRKQMEALAEDMFNSAKVSIVPYFSYMGRVQF